MLVILQRVPMLQRNLSTTPDSFTPPTFVHLLDEIHDLEKILKINELYTKWNNANIHNISGLEVFKWFFIVLHMYWLKTYHNAGQPIW